MRHYVSAIGIGVFTIATLFFQNCTRNNFELRSPAGEAENPKLKTQLSDIDTQSGDRTVSSSPADPNDVDGNGYLVGAFYQPGWNAYQEEGQDQVRSSSIITCSMAFKSCDRMPKAGWHIDQQENLKLESIWAKNNGVDFFVFNYFHIGKRFNDEMAAAPPNGDLKSKEVQLRSLNSALESFSSDAFIKSTHLRYAIQYVNRKDIYNVYNNPKSSDKDPWVDQVKVWGQHFKNPRYLSIQGRPVFYVYTPNQFDYYFEKPADCALKYCSVQAALKKFNDIMKTPEFFGPTFNGVHFVALEKGQAFAKRLSQGYVAVTSYGAGDFKLLSCTEDAEASVPDKFRLKTLIEGQRKRYGEYLASPNDLKIIPAVIPGFDNRPWRDDDPGTDKICFLDPEENTPYSFRKMLTMAKDLVDQNPSRNLSGKKIIMISAWNELGLGQYLVPTIRPMIKSPLDCNYGRFHQEPLHHKLSCSEGMAGYSENAISDLRQNEHSSFFSYLRQIKPVLSKNKEMVDIVIVAGQSNAYGPAASGDNKYERDLDDSDILFSYHVGTANGTVSDANPDYLVSEFGGSDSEGALIKTLEPTPFVGEGNTRKGLEIEFARNLYRNANFIGEHHKLMIVKVTYGASSLESHWLKSKPDFLGKFATHIEKVKSDLSKRGYLPRFRGMIWIQGESDTVDNDTSGGSPEDQTYSLYQSNATCTSATFNSTGHDHNKVKNYKDNLSQVFMRARKVTGNSGLKIFVGKTACISGRENASFKIRKAQTELAESSGGTVKVIDLDSLWACYKEDRFHYQKKAYNILGGIFYQSYKSSFPGDMKPGSFNYSWSCD